MTKITNISYRGIKYTPSNLSDKDGSALECVNLTQDGTDLKPMPMPAIQYDADGNLIHFPKNTTLVAVHEVTGERHYILTSPNADGKPVTLYFKDQDNEDIYSQSSWTNGSEIYAVESIGNTLVVSTANGIEYFYWKNGAYVYLGQKPPMPVLQFELHNDIGDDEKIIKTDLYSIYARDGNPIKVVHYAGETPEDYSSYIQADYLADFEDYVKSVISSIEKKISDKGMFLYPFYVRYALRIGSDYIMQSAPILMMPSSEKCPIFVNFSSFVFVSYMRGRAVASELQVKLEGYESQSISLSDWKDIVDGIDVFVSLPIKSFDTTKMDGGDKEIVDNIVFDAETTGPGAKLGYYANSGGSVIGKKCDLGKSFANGIVTDINEIQTLEGAYYDIEEISEKDVYEEKVVSDLVFHKIASYDIDELDGMTSFEKVPIDNLGTLANLPTLTDDYNSHCAMSARLLQQYNGRVNMANIDIKAYEGYPISMFTQSILHQHRYGAHTISINKMLFKLNKDGRDIVVSKDYDNTSSLDYSKFIFYPDENCFEAVAVITYDTSTTKYLVLPMKKHGNLNGSYWYNEKTLGEYIEENLALSTSTSPYQESQDDEKWYSLPNRFAMSAVGNPWYFPVANMFDIGKREIRSLSINAEELSYAQYGQNPILVLASDGTWSLGIQGDGSPKGVSYISSDVISKMETLTDTPSVTANQATFFVTDRGLMMASGSKVIEVGRDMHGAIFDCKNELLPQNSVLPTPIHIAFNEIINKVTDNIPFADYIKGANLAWDYKHNRLLVINKAHPYVYVYDLSYDFWSKMLITDTMLPIAEGYQHNTKSTVKFTQCVNNGTELFMQDNNGYLYDIKGDIDENDIDELQYGFYVSRPMRFGADTFKTIVRLKHRMTKKASGENVKMMLYGSRDGNTFYRISTMRGSSYMYFIVVLYTTMLPAQRYAYTSFEFEDRLTNKLR